jgi:hypothetical protein
MRTSVSGTENFALCAAKIPFVESSITIQFSTGSPAISAARRKLQDEVLIPLDLHR